MRLKLSDLKDSRPEAEEAVALPAGSPANPADIPTRPDRFGELPDHVEWVEMVLPPVELIEADFAGWIARVRAA